MTHPGPRMLVNIPAIAGFACRIHRRGVTPLVTFLIRPGNIWSNSGNSLDFTSLV